MHTSREGRCSRCAASLCVSICPFVLVKRQYLYCCRPMCRGCMRGALQMCRKTMPPASLYWYKITNADVFSRFTTQANVAWLYEQLYSLCYAGFTTQAVFALLRRRMWRGCMSAALRLRCRKTWTLLSASTSLRPLRSVDLYCSILSAYCKHIV
jgi:hypothetical protein